jgi:hypothetical protein
MYRDLTFFLQITADTDSKNRLQEKDRVIQQQRLELERFRNGSTGGSVPGGLDRIRTGSGSIRQHGSFRQYKKEKIRQRNYESSSESNLSSSTG